MLSAGLGPAGPAVLLVKMGAARIAEPRFYHRYSDTPAAPAPLSGASAGLSAPAARTGPRIHRTGRSVPETGRGPLPRSVSHSPGARSPPDNDRARAMICPMAFSFPRIEFNFSSNSATVSPPFYPAVVSPIPALPLLPCVRFYLPVPPPPGSSSAGPS